MSLTFKRTKEDFVCGHCGLTVAGNGYTNHCPQCLYSRHVDVHPGDRREPCRGLMPPVSYELKGGEYVVTQRCERCGHEKKNRLAPADNLEALAALQPPLA